MVVRLCVLEKMDFVGNKKEQIENEEKVLN